MNPTPVCPVCARSDWEEVGARSYCANVDGGTDSYIDRRIHVLFTLWAPGNSELSLKSLLCNCCGFVLYAPRPTDVDIDNKYRFLNSLTCDEPQEEPDDKERQRARRMWHQMHNQLRRSPSRILDFGGGDGRLMVPFLENGHNCFVVDYNPRTVPGVLRLGSTIEDVDIEEKFDAIVCSHVIEHVAEPFEILRALTERLTDGGSIYVEVPMEIWGKAPLQIEPVTHVNFFTIDSLRILMQRAGLCEVQAKWEGYDHPSGHRAVVVTAVGRRIQDRSDEVSFRGAADATRALLQPNLAIRFQRAMLSPTSIPRNIIHKLRQHWH